MKGGKDGQVIVAGKPDKSLLLQRVTLPPDHKQFMPAEGKPPLQPEEIAWIRAWIQQGASPTAAEARRNLDSRRDARSCRSQPVGDYSALMPEIRQMENGQGAKLMPVSSKAVGWIDSQYSRCRWQLSAMRSWRSSRNSRPILLRQSWAARP